VVAQYHPRALRWFLVNTQYRQPINYTQRALEEVSGWAGWLARWLLSSCFGPNPCWSCLVLWLSHGSSHERVELAYNKEAVM
jgi:hypothetical protein